MDKFHAVKGINEDSRGYDFISYKWRGAKEVSPGRYQLIELDGEDAIAAHLQAVSNKLLVKEDTTTTGGIGIGFNQSLFTPAIGTTPRRAKKKEKKVIFGGKLRSG